MLLATMLALLTTDAVVDAATLVRAAGGAERDWTVPVHVGRALRDADDD